MKKNSLQKEIKNIASIIPAVLDGIITNPSMKSDFLHPNAKGYQMIARRVYNAVLPYINKNASLK